MCLACVQRSTPQPVPEPAELADWSPADAQLAETVYRQLPRWSRRLFDALSARPGAGHNRSELRVTVLEEHDPFDIEDACRWAAEFCAAARRRCPVDRTYEPGTGETRYQMDDTTARLFRRLAVVQANGGTDKEPA
jgi:Family of unknown function (DUF6416)